MLVFIENLIILSLQRMSTKKIYSIEICAGAGGQALGLEQAGFEHLALVEIEPLACKTLKANRPQWNVVEGDVKSFHAQKYNGVDLLAGGVPCPPFSVAGKQLGHLDERDLFPEALRLINECHPKAVLLENVRGLLDDKFEDYRNEILKELHRLGYEYDWQLVNASDYGVSQLRPRAILIALKKEYFPYFKWPEKHNKTPKSVGKLLYDEMKSAGWQGAEEWLKQATGVAPTLVGGSKKHGGADLGPTRAKKAWAALGVDGGGLADGPPSQDHTGMPRLNLKMTALVQGFPDDWEFVGKKTPAYRQVGNAFPPPVAKAVGTSIINAIREYEKNHDIMNAKSAKGKGSKAKLREYFIEHVGEVINKATLQEVAEGASEWARRVRELRDEEGYNILTHNDRSDLKNGEYLLTDLKPRPAFERGISKETRAYVLDRNGFTCQMCGAVAGEPHPYDQGRKTRLHIGHIIDKSVGGTDDANNLKAICSVCNEGASNLTLTRPDLTKLLIQVRRAPGNDQLEVLKWLIGKFPKQAADLVENDK